MKKYMFIFCCLFLLFPVVGNAVSIREVEIKSNQSEIVVGEPFKIEINVRFDGLVKGDDKKFGIWEVVMGFDYDENALAWSKPDVDGFASAPIMLEGIPVLGSVVDEKIKNNSCDNGRLLCGDYTITLEFIPRNAEYTSTAIEFEDVMAVYTSLDEKGEPTFEDIDETAFLDYSFKKEFTYEIKANQNNVKIEVPKEANSTNNKIAEAVKSVKKQTTTKKTNKVASDSAYLKSLEIEGYAIDFKNYKTEYTIEVEDNVNELKVKAVPENGKASCKVIGSGNLEANKDVVNIEVTHNKKKVNYIINVKRKKAKKVNKEKDEEKEKISLGIVDKLMELKENKKVREGFITGCIALIGIILVTILFKKIKNRKLNKKFKDL